MYKRQGADIVLAIKARFRRWPATALKLVDEINEIERAIRMEFTAVRFIFFEPDISKTEKLRRAQRKGCLLYTSRCV